MDAYARRKQIAQILEQEKHVSIVSLAARLNVSERTIRRDIDVLSLSGEVPLYIDRGRYNGGVKLLEVRNYKTVRITREQINALRDIAIRGKGQPCYIKETELAEINAFLACNGVQVLSEKCPTSTHCWAQLPKK